MLKGDAAEHRAVSSKRRTPRGFRTSAASPPRSARSPRRSPSTRTRCSAPTCVYSCPRRRRRWRWRRPGTWDRVGPQRGGPRAPSAQTRRWTTRAPPPSRRWRRWRHPLRTLDEPVPAAAAAAAAAARPRPTRRAPSRRCSCRPSAPPRRARSPRRERANDATRATRRRAPSRRRARAALRQCALRFPPSVTLPPRSVRWPTRARGGAAPSSRRARRVRRGRRCARDAVDDDARAKHVLAALQLGVQSGDAATARAAARAAAHLTEHAGHALASLHGGDGVPAVRRRPFGGGGVEQRQGTRVTTGTAPRASPRPRTRRPSPSWRTAATRSCLGDAPRSSPPRWWAARRPRRARARARGALVFSPQHHLGGLWVAPYAGRDAPGAGDARRRGGSRRGRRGGGRSSRRRSPRWRRWWRRRAPSTGSWTPSWTRRREGCPTPRRIRRLSP